MDPAVARFVARHHVSRREEVEADVAEHRGRSLEESWRDVAAVCRAAAWALAAQPDRDRIVAEVDAPHPSYPAIVRKLRARSGE